MLIMIGPHQSSCFLSIPFLPWAGIAKLSLHGRLYPHHSPYDSHHVPTNICTSHAHCNSTYYSPDHHSCHAHIVSPHRIQHSTRIILNPAPASYYVKCSSPLSLYVGNSGFQIYELHCAGFGYEDDAIGFCFVEYP